jgi:predicted RNA-binding protein with PUA-like domain
MGCTGVRNHQAKKILQAMRQGDQAFFYASNCKEPGIVGIVEV